MDVKREGVAKKKMIRRVFYLVLLVAVVAGVLVAVLALFFQYTRVGRALRAVADDHQAALSVGRGNGDSMFRAKLEGVHFPKTGEVVLVSTTARKYLSFVVVKLMVGLKDCHSCRT